MKNSQNPLNSNANSAKNSQKTPVIASLAKARRSNPQPTNNAFLATNSNKNCANSLQNSQNSVNLMAISKENSVKIDKITNSKKPKTFWPYGILLSLFAIVAACVATIVFSLDYPVYEDDAYLQKYQQVDNNYNEIQAKDTAFKRNYRVVLNLEPKMDTKNRPFYEIKQGTKELEFMVQEVDEGKYAGDIKPVILLTRPHTSEQDMWLDTSELVLNNVPFIDIRGKTITGLKKSFNRYTFVAFLPESLSKGRWQIKLNAQKTENSIGFYEFNLLVSE